MDSNLAQLPDPGRVLAAALISAGKELGLTQAALGAVIGRDRTALRRGHLRPASNPREPALLLIRAYRALFVLVGGDRAVMRHWMQTENLHTGGIPAEQIRRGQGLTRGGGDLR